MGWRLAVEHVTEYEYAGDVLASYNETRLSPRRDQRQLVLDHRIEVRPTASLLRYVDYWGSDVCAFDVHELHRRLVVTGRSLVETDDARPAPDPIDAPTWEVLGVCEVRDEFHEYLSPSRYVPADDRLIACASGLASNRSPVDTVAAVVEWTREHMVYEPGATDASTTASDAVELGRGVCQDFVHISIALLRGAGIPARYVSGYLHPQSDAAIGETVVGQSHAWLEAWLGRWHAVDPTNGDDVGPRHVVVAEGRDYADVVPLKGVFHGPPEVSTEVTVAITRVA